MRYTILVHHVNSIWHRLNVSVDHRGRDWLATPMVNAAPNRTMRLHPASFFGCERQSIWPTVLMYACLPALLVGESWLCYYSIFLFSLSFGEVERGYHTEPVKLLQHNACHKLLVCLRCQDRVVNGYHGHVGVVGRQTATHPSN